MEEKRESLTWREARKKSGLRTNAIVEALGYSNSATFYNRERHNTFLWSDVAVLCKLYGVDISQIVK